MKGEGKSSTMLMTEGVIWKQLLLFSLPLLVGNLFQQLYNTVDSIVVGNFIGSQALAAVGSSTPLINLIIGMFMGIATGAGVIISQYYGAENEQKLSWAVHTCIALSILGGVLLSILGMVLSPYILNWMGTPEDVIENSVIYLQIYFSGSLFNLLYNMAAGILRAVGDSRRPLYYLCISSAVNIVLDLVFIIVFRMGAAGAAYATVIAQGISGILCLLYIAKKVPALYLHREDWEIDKNLAGWQLKIGLPMAFQYSITAIGTIVVQSCLNILGSTAAAGFAAASKIEQVFTQAYVALGTTMATYCAQNMGAGKYTRIRKGFKSATLIGFIYAVVTGVIIFFVGKYMTIFFVSENVNQIMEYVDIYLRCVSVSFLPLVIVNLYRNGIQGMGYGLLPMTAGIAELVGRSGASLIASHFGSYMGICLASPAAWVLAGTLLLIMYFEIMKGKKDRNLKNR